QRVLEMHEDCERAKTTLVFKIIDKILNASHPSLNPRIMTMRVTCYRFKLFEQILLFTVQIYWGFHKNSTMQIARRPTTNRLNTHAFYFEDFTCLGFSGYF